MSKLRGRSDKEIDDRMCRRGAVVYDTALHLSVHSTYVLIIISGEYTVVCVLPVVAPSKPVSA